MSEPSNIEECFIFPKRAGWVSRLSLEKKNDEGSEHINLVATAKLSGVKSIRVSCKQRTYSPCRMHLTRMMVSKFFDKNKREY